MYIDSCTYTAKNGKQHTRILLRTSYRKNGKVLHKTIANLSQCPSQDVEAIRFALKHKNHLDLLASRTSTPVHTRQGLSVGAVYALHEIAKRLGLSQILGHSQNGLLALWLIIARIIHPGSRLSAVRLAAQHAACDLLGLDAFHEDHLYATLDWLDEQQHSIENRLFRRAKQTHPPALFLYDVTSSYFEGLENELADYGYGRDGKKGKKQIVIGLLTDEEGDPISVQVYQGNTSDNKTFADQVDKVKKRFGGKSVTMVGDRGMIKSTQIEQLPESFHYLTAITKPQIKTLLKEGALQMELFDETVCEIEWKGVRYVLRRNPVRVKELSDSRHNKQQDIQRVVDQQNAKLKANPRTWVSTALRLVTKKIHQLKLHKWVTATAKNRTLSLQVNEEALKEISLLDGCYVLKTDVPATETVAQVLHDRYKDLAMIEWAFRTMKTILLEMRPHYVRKESRTRGHVCSVMLAYKIIRYLADAWQGFDITVEEGINELASICSVEVSIGDAKYQTVPEPRLLGKQLLQAIQVELPEAIPSRGIHVATRKKLIPRL